jgi:hypothetical protein
VLGGAGAGGKGLSELTISVAQRDAMADTVYVGETVMRLLSTAHPVRSGPPLEVWKARRTEVTTRDLRSQA